MSDQPVYTITITMPDNGGGVRSTFGPVLDAAKDHGAIRAEVRRSDAGGFVFTETYDGKGNHVR